MNAKRFALLWGILASVLLAGCTPFQQTLIGDERGFPAKQPGDVKVFLASQTPPQPYKEVGAIVATESSEEAAVSFLQEKAAAMGADALMNCEVRVHTMVLLIIIIPIPEHKYTASAVAVKYTNPG